MKTNSRIKGEKSVTGTLIRFIDSNEVEILSTNSSSVLHQISKFELKRGALIDLIGDSLAGNRNYYITSFRLLYYPEDKKSRRTMLEHKLYAFCIIVRVKEICTKSSQTIKF